MRQRNPLPDHPDTAVLRMAARLALAQAKRDLAARLYQIGAARAAVDAQARSVKISEVVSVIVHTSVQDGALQRRVRLAGDYQEGHRLRATPRQTHRAHHRPRTRAAPARQGKAAMRTLDRAAVEALTREIMRPIRGHFLGRPQSVDTNLEVLNALAIAAAVIIAGARAKDCEIEARQFFTDALEQQIEEGLL